MTARVTRIDPSRIIAKWTNGRLRAPGLVDGRGCGRRAGGTNGGCGRLAGWTGAGTRPGGTHDDPLRFLDVYGPLIPVGAGGREHPPLVMPRCPA
ncbi:hypothetical protein [Streptomyces sp. NPDC088707]|uniref:hypothetical protein n=1 Tax=Streptomyces sp. NPDC088707 TaxID=3365871 RepID=UPI0037F8FF65